MSETRTSGRHSRSSSNAVPAEAQVRTLVASWCDTDGPDRIHRAALVDAAPATSSAFAGLGLDVRQALRVLRHQPGVASLSILMIALGIGVTAALFSLVNGVLLKPLPWKEADRLVRVYEERSGMSASNSGVHTLTNVTYRAWADGPTTIDAIGAAILAHAGLNTIHLLLFTYPELGVVP